MGCNVSQTVEFAVADNAVSGSQDASQNSMLVDISDGEATESVVSGSHDVSHNSMEVDNSDSRYVNVKQVGNPAAVASASFVENIAKRNFNLEEAKQRLKHLKVNSSLGTTVQANVVDTRVEPQASRFAGRSIHDLVVVEVFAGSARLTKACKGLGMRAVAVDKTSGRSEGPHIFHCDVTEPKKKSSIGFFPGSRKR